MTLTDGFFLLLIMATLAAIPSSSVALVVARSATLDVKNGIATSGGIVVGDLIFMTLAILGMTTLAAQMGTFFALIKYLAAAYLIWFGFTLIRSQLQKQSASPVAETSTGKTGNLLTSFTAGLLLTLGDVKAIFFYASLLPTFLDLAALTVTDIALVSLITIVGVGGVKVIYAFAANRIGRMSANYAHTGKIKIFSGGLLMAAGGYLALKS